MQYFVVKDGYLAHVRSYETSNPSKSHAVFTCAISDLPRVKNMLSSGGAINTDKYTLKFNKGWLTIKYTWNKALYKKVMLVNLKDLINVLSSAMGKKESPIKSWLKRWMARKKSTVT